MNIRLDERARRGDRLAAAADRAVAAGKPEWARLLYRRAAEYEQMLLADARLGDRRLRALLAVSTAAYVDVLEACASDRFSRKRFERARAKHNVAIATIKIFQDIQNWSGVCSKILVDMDVEMAALEALPPGFRDEARFATHHAKIFVVRQITARYYG